VAAYLIESLLVYVWRTVRNQIPNSAPHIR